MKRKKLQNGKNRTWRFECEKKPKKYKQRRQQRRRSRELIRDGRFNDELYTL